MGELPPPTQDIVGIFWNDADNDGVQSLDDAGNPIVMNPEGERVIVDYDEDGTVCGIALPDGLREASKLPEPIFTPSTKADLGDHDENISFERCAQIVGPEVADRLRSLSIALYKAASEYAAERGIIIADTKFEFGLIDGEIVLIDECLTPDSSRFWPASTYGEGEVQPSYDKQYVRDWLRANWDMEGEPPHLPADVVEGTAARYQEAYEIVCGEPFVPAKEQHVSA